MQKRGGVCYNTPMDHTTEILDSLNDEQIKPVLATEGAVLVLAGAGSGKTRVLTARIAHLIEDLGVPPEAILAITFTNKAANEMKERLSRLADTQGMWVCTIHSMCVRILRMFSREAGIEKNFSIYSETERSNIVKKSFQECDFDDDKFLKSVKWHIANAKMLGLFPEEYAREYAGEPDIDDIVKVYSRYQAHLKENNSLDFDDLLNETRLLLKRDEEVRGYLGGRFRYILVDEFQDTNAVQFEIVRMLGEAHGNVFAVGDDDQSIYGWRGAKIENILHFEKFFPGAQTFKLERNYRSTGNILRLANAVIHNNGKRKDKTLWTKNGEGEKPQVFEAEEESGEARFVARTIDELVRKGYKYSDFAVLMRINALTRSFEQEFTADAISYKVFGGFKFFERKEIKDLLAYLRLINNPFDSEAAVRIINFPKRGIGAKTVEALERYAEETELSVYDALLDVDSMNFSAATARKLTEFKDLIKNWIVESQELPVNELVRRIVADTNMREAYSDGSDESENKLANIDEFISSVDDYCRLNKEAVLSDYLSQVTLSSDTDDMDDGNYVTLATIHSVKGLEFRCVFIVGLEENVLPGSRASESEDGLEEERRLMYVAVTRARERLYLTRSKSRYLYGRREPTARSRFLKELASELSLPSESRSFGRGTEDGWYADDDPEAFGNAAYGAARYSSGAKYGRDGGYGGGYGRSYGGGYGNYASGSYGSYGSSYGGRDRSRENSAPRRADGISRQSAAGAFTYGGAAPQKKPAAAGKDLTAFRTGVTVSHPKFGTGTIVAVRGAGANMILDVAFAGLGIKQLSASLAPLTVI